MKVGVLMGGLSSEREVSLRSGSAVAAALKSKGHDVVAIDVTSEEIDRILVEGIKVYFIALHGKFGEDGSLQRLLEERGISFTGSGSKASAVAMDKIVAREVFRATGIPIADGVVVRNTDSVDEADRSARRLGYPVVLKPRAEGSSVGVSVHQNRDTLSAGLSEALKGETEAVMEKWVGGREITVGILEDRPLPLIEMIPKRTFFDYTAKYQDQGTQYIVKPQFSEATIAKAQAAALAAHVALGCRCISRVDMIVTKSDDLVVLEVNTIPGLTERSLLPKAARSAGVEFPDLCEAILRDALRR